jgi:AcrR family transcriptional regulator
MLLWISEEQGSQMPRQPDAQLEQRILNAAYDLWRKGGEQALTMRAVAKAASTTTPTLYQRFRDKRKLLAGLRARAQQKLFDAIKPVRSIADACRVAIDFTMGHGHEYELVAKDWATRLSRNEPTPVLDLLKVRLAEQLGGAAEDHAERALGLALLYHGASMLLLQDGLRPKTAAAIRQACNSAFDALIEDGVRKAESPKRAVR